MPVFLLTAEHFPLPNFESARSVEVAASILPLLVLPHRQRRSTTPVRLSLHPPTHSLFATTLSSYLLQHPRRRQRPPHDTCPCSTTCLCHLLTHDAWPKDGLFNHMRLCSEMTMTGYPRSHPTPSVDVSSLRKAHMSCPHARWVHGRVLVQAHHSLLLHSSNNHPSNTHLNISISKQDSNIPHPRYRHTLGGRVCLQLLTFCAVVQATQRTPQA